MLSSRISIRRTFLRQAQSLKPLTVFLRNQKTEAISVESPDSTENSQEIARPFEEIPGPKQSLRSTYDLYRLSESWTKSYRMTEKFFKQYGPIYKDDLLGYPVVHISEPDDMEKIFRAEGKYPRRITIDWWVEHRKRRNYFQGMFNLNGEEWHRVRQAVAPKVMRPKIVEENIDNFNAVAKDAVDRLVRLKETCGPSGEIPDLEGELSKWSTESVGMLAFDARLGLYEDPPKEEALVFIQAVNDFFTLTCKLFFGVTNRFLSRFMDTPTLKKLFKVSDVILDIGQRMVDKKMGEIKEMAEKGVDTSSDDTQVVPLLTYLLLKGELTPEEVNATAIDVVSAGVDTTSTSMLWLLYHLARLPDVQEQVYQELQSMLGNNDEVTAQNLGRMSYMKACLKESMRLTPAFPANSRFLEKDVVLSGYNVPAQTLIVTEFYYTCLLDMNFKDPLEFKPERWLRENKNKSHAFASLPFGFGPRMCLGRRVAELEIYLLLCKILQRFRMEYHHEPVEMHQKLIAVPDRPLKIKFINRQ